MSREPDTAKARPGRPGRRFGLGDWACLAVVMAGAALRIPHWLAGRSLWQDEAYLAVSVLTRDLLGLARPLELNQSAPYLFLAATDLLTRLLGDGERVLHDLVSGTCGVR